jgi:poly-gamma-glutamate synthesis protein (capsule biosynthesis protein)
MIEQPIILAIAGDVMLGRLVNASIDRRGFAYPWGDVLPARERADLFLVNLECALTDSFTPWRDGAGKTFYFGAAPSVVETLKAGHVDFVSMANNHAGDFGAEGLVDTLRVLDAAGIAHAGAGLSSRDASAPTYLTADGLRVGVIACADHPAAWAATETSAGVNYVRVVSSDDSFAGVREVIARARANADLVVFSIHWGPNMRERPTRAFRTFAKQVVDAGVDVFWGHSAHIVQGIEFWHGGVILYDTGDFIDDYAVDGGLRNDLSALFFVRVATAAGIQSVELLPVRIDDMQVCIAGGADRAWFVKRVAKRCAEVGTEVHAMGADGMLQVRRNVTGD